MWSSIAKSVFSFALWTMFGFMVLVIFLLATGLKIPLLPPQNPSHLPDRIATSGTYLSQDQIGGFLEGCVFEAYELAPGTVAAIERSGLQFFENMPQPSDAVSKFGAWRLTPVPDRPYPYALGALTGCKNDSSVRDTIGYVGASEPGNYYSLSSNGEGIIIVYPKRKLVVFAYFG